MSRWAGFSRAHVELRENVRPSIHEVGEYCFSRTFFSGLLRSLDKRAGREVGVRGSEVVLACGAIYSYPCLGGVQMAGKISISITDEHAAVVQEAVRSGAYASSSEVIREALREWRAKRVVGELWDEGLASGRCGDGVSMADIKREARRRLTGT